MIKTDLLGFVVTMHSGLCEHYVQSQGITASGSDFHCSHAPGEDQVVIPYNRLLRIDVELASIRDFRVWSILNQRCPPAGLCYLGWNSLKFNISFYQIIHFKYLLIKWEKGICFKINYYVRKSSYLYNGNTYWWNSVFILKRPPARNAKTISTPNGHIRPVLKTRTRINAYKWKQLVPDASLCLNYIGFSKLFLSIGTSWHYPN